MLDFIRCHISTLNLILALGTSSLLALNGFRALMMWIDAKSALMDLYFAVRFEDKIESVDDEVLDDLRQKYKEQKEAALKRTEEVMIKKYPLFSLRYFKVDPCK